MASDSDSDEDFVTYGIPLEPLEEDEPRRKPIPVHEQTVKDEKGRYQRFHGAFTGGFSAGYFNTVGTKEGWTPSTFVSSRQQKVERQSARPEDFMDEEDLGEHGIAPREITTTEDFHSGRSDPLREKARALSAMTGPIPGDTLLDDLIAPARTSIGVQLLRKMGWRDGQGVGPRFRKRKLGKGKADAGQRVYGCALPQEGSEGSEDGDDEFAPEDVTFAPKDVTPVDFSVKEDVHGLGYRGLNPGLALSGGDTRGRHFNLFTFDSDRASSLFGEKTHTRRGGVTGQAFGVGADEDEDEDVYHRDAMSNYDSVLGGEEPGDGLFGWTAPQQYNNKKNNSKKDAAYLGKILEGFTLASNTEEPKTVFPPPVLPRDYRPVHYFRPVLDMSSVSPVVAAALRESKGHMTQPTQEAGRHQLDSAQRRDLLGETSLKGPSSVFELLRPEDQEKLSRVRQSAAGEKQNVPDLASESGRAAVVAAAKASALQALSSRFQSQPQGAPESQALSSRFQSQPQGAAESHALAVWSAPTADTKSTFKPFDKNPSKQARYDQYLSLLKQGHKDALERSLDVCMTEWERGREREEFVRAALLYKPSSSALSSRFTRSRQDDSDDTVEVPRDTENNVDDKQAAVKMKMFGKLTRDTFEWHPDKLLCKRFNVPDPYPGSGLVGMPKVKRDRFSVFNFLTVDESPTASSQSTTHPTASSSSSKAPGGGKRSRWDMSPPPADQSDPLSALISEARNEASQSHTDTPAKPKETERKDGTEEGDEEKGEEEEEEESRPPIDLFKAIFSSSDDKSSSSGESDEDQEEEEEPKRPGADGKAEALTPGPISFSRTPLATPTAPQTASTAQPPSLPARLHGSDTATGRGVAEERGAAPPSTAACKDGGQEEEEFGPRLPPPIATGSLVLREEEEERSRKKSKEKRKAKKEHKHKKHKKKQKKTEAQREAEEKEREEGRVRRQLV
ncbi:G patch domain-containing protein 1 isoform X2 [Alosa sapidissima]|uniref:G patch domain-containing protein 1 isoform X2 n=1 Tax=Alosa sapidissima TaxID=34773 RepID=UPI001C0952EC|nr:G patch domain-containing protein 1 isoform X2 [Alosa sapidissima]